MSLLRALDLVAQRVELGDERHQPVLERADGLEFVLRIGHLLDHAVARRLQRVELGASRELRFELVIDVRAEGVQAIEARLQLFDKRQAGRDARELGVELGHRFVEPGGFLRALFHQRQFSEDGVHFRVELGSARGHRRHAIAEGFERLAIGAQLVAELGDLGVRLVEVLHFGPQRPRDPGGSA